MKFYNQSDLFWTLISATRSPQLTPDPMLLQQYKASRIRAAIKAVRAKNIFLYTEGTRTSVNLNDITTIYTQPAGTRLIVVGYSDNLRYGITQQADDAGVVAYVDVVFPQAHRVRVIGGNDNGVSLSDDLVMAQSGASGQPRFTSTLLPVPFILEANEQIAVDLGYDTAMSEPAHIPAQAFTFFCVKVKDVLTAEDATAIEEAKTYITSHDYQRGVFLNCVSLAHNDVEFDTALAGGVAVCHTRPANGPLLITGIGTTLFASALLITDMGDGHSFSLNRAIQSSAINFADNADARNAVPAVPAGAFIWQHYFDFPVPHFLKPGAALKVEAINVGNPTASGNVQLDTQLGNIIMFQGVTV